MNRMKFYQMLRMVEIVGDENDWYECEVERIEMSDDLEDEVDLMLKEIDRWVRELRVEEQDLMRRWFALILDSMDDGFDGVGCEGWDCKRAWVEEVHEMNI